LKKAEELAADWVNRIQGKPHKLPSWPPGWRSRLIAWGGLSRTWLGSILRAGLSLASAGGAIQTSWPLAVDRLNDFKQSEAIPSGAYTRNRTNAKHAAVMVRYALIETKLVMGVDFTEEIASHCIDNLILEHVPNYDAS
jgi:hypothetical protein